MERPAIIGLAALVAGALATSAVLMRTQTEEPASPAPTHPDVGYYATNARLTGTDDQGHFLYSIAAKSVIQDPADGDVDLHDVTVNYDPAVKVPWTLNADTGRVLPNGRMIELAGHVVAESRETEGPRATIRTDFMQFDPATNVASTDRKVVIDYGGSSVHATGMRASLAEDRLELVQGVTGHYVR
jgi:lipopolysaccharide export system protein LptC